MLVSLYVLIIIITLQKNYCETWQVPRPNPIRNPHFGRELTVETMPAVKKVIFDRSVNSHKNLKKRPSQSAKIVPKMSDVKYFENIQEYQTSSERTTIVTQKITTLTNLNEIKSILNRLLVQINNLENDKKRDCSGEIVPTKGKTEELTGHNPQQTQAAQGSKERHKFLDMFKGKDNEDPDNIAKKAKWADWTDWSACSVSCGKGREIRWRQCKENCDGVETEMEEKSCQLIECPPVKLFGVLR